MPSPKFPEDYPYTDALLEWVTELPERSQHEELPEAFWKAALAEGFFPQLYRYSGFRDLQRPEWASEAWRTNAMRVAINRREMRRILDAFDGAGIEVVILKGEPLARLLFDDPHLRKTFDIDLLGRARDRRAACDVLESELGYEQATPYKPWASNEIAFDHPERSTRAEFHWLVTTPHLPSPTPESLLDDKSSIRLEDSRVSIPAPHHNFLELCYHFHRHRGFFRGLLDIAAWLDRFEREMPWRRIATLARDLRVEGLVAWPIATLDRIAATDTLDRSPLPASWTAELLGMWSLQRWTKRFGNPDPPTDDAMALDSKLIRLGERLVTMTTVGGARRKLRALAGPIFLGRHALGGVTARLLPWIDSRLNS